LRFVVPQNQLNWGRVRVRGETTFKKPNKGPCHNKLEGKVGQTLRDGKRLATEIPIGSAKEGGLSLNSWFLGGGRPWGRTGEI